MYIKKLMPKHLQKQKEFGMIDFMKEIDFDTWMEIGLEKGWCGPPVCYVHDGLPMSEEEWIEEEANGEPPCMHIIRLYEDDEHRLEIEESHSPSIWRKPYNMRDNSSEK